LNGPIIEHHARLRGQTVDTDDGAREIRQRMAGLRRELELDARKLEADVQSVSRSARELADWRFYVERFPLAAAAGAAIVGYMIVPRRPQVIVPDADTLAQMAKNNQVWVKTGRAKPVEKERGLMGGLVALAMTAAGRMAMNWATEQFKTQLVARQQATGNGRTEHEESQQRTSPYPPR
jgi:hypothetical protein